MKTINTNRYYGREPRIVWIYNQPISDEFPDLFEAFWRVYEAWYHHEEQAKKGLSSFLFDSKIPQAEQYWKRERFGNYLYGSLISIYFSWESLKAVRAGCDPRNIRGNLDLIRQINGVVRYLFTSLDALACCIYIAEDQIPPGLTQEKAEPKHLSKLSIKSISKTAKKVSAYAQLHSLLKRPEFVYLCQYRNLLTHRPFPQFKIDSEGLYYLPESLIQLDSMTQQKKQYHSCDVGAYLTSAFELMVADLRSLLLELGVRYRKRI